MRRSSVQLKRRNNGSLAELRKKRRRRDGEATVCKRNISEASLAYYVGVTSEKVRRGWVKEARRSDSVAALGMRNGRFKTAGVDRRTLSIQEPDPQKR